MPFLSVQLSSSAIINGGKNFNISDPNVQDVLNWATVAYATQINAAFNSTGSTSFVPTNGQVLSTWVQQWINGTKDAVLKFKQDSAAATAIQGTTGIVIST